MVIRRIVPAASAAPPAEAMATPPLDGYPPPRRRRRVIASPGNDGAETAASEAEPVRSTASDSQSELGRAAAPAPKPKQRRGHAKRNAEGKYEPTGDYEAGFARPPLYTRFDGSKPGPGRPKGLRSQASYLREALEEKLILTENGVQLKISKRQASAKLYVKAALENPDKQVMANMQKAAQLLYPERTTSEVIQSPFGDASRDADVITQFLAGLSLGEPDPDVEDAAPSSSSQDLSVSGKTKDEAWDEGDWNLPGERHGNASDQDPENISHD